jgi:transcriptional regulator with XRE-family HTH domain
MGVQINGARLRRELERRGLHQNELARLAGVHPMTIHAACRGRRVEAATLRRIADALKKTPVLDLAEALTEPEVA